jgi:large subunit ribosomal protein L23
MYPLATEKAMRIMESENKVVLIVDKNTTRREIKEGFEKEFGVKVEKVNIVVVKGGKKKAYVKIKEGKAADVATKLGVL